MADNQTRGYVLIVEGDEASLDLAGNALRPDVHLWAARDSDQARNILAENRVDLVIADHRMPGEGGVALLRFVAKEQPQIRRFLLTENADSSEVVQACQESVVERFFLKPFSPLRLKSAVLEYLRPHGLAKAPRVLVADDSDSIRSMVCQILKTRSIETVEAADGAQAIQRLSQGDFDAAIVDLSMPGLGGVAVLRYVQTSDPDLPVLILSAQEYSVGINFLEAGAFDFMSKPFKQAELVMRVDRALLARQQAVEHRRLLEEVRLRRRHVDTIAQSPGMQRVLEQAHTVAAYDVNVLVTGETGTGKEVVARLVHKSSRRATGAFVAVNCGGLPETLIESELFGHQKGAFTDAKETKQGIFEAADGGIVFLDEIGELTPQSQVRLLRVLETKEVTRLGSTRPVRVDVRVIAATHQDLETMIVDGRFRRDLYYRLNAFRIEIPPLRDRREDIAPLIELAVAEFCSRSAVPVPEISPRVVHQAEAYDWPGNVRELLHAVERALITRGGANLEHLDVGTSPVASSAGLAEAPIDARLPMREALEPIFEQVEKRYLNEVLTLCDGHLSRAAEHAGIHRKSLYNKMRRYGLSAKDM